MIRQGISPFTMNTEDEETTIMPSRGLKLIGVRFYPYVGRNGEDERKAKCIQKSLYGRTEWFYFNKGFEIFECKNGDIEKITVDESAFDSNRYLYSRSDKFRNISVSAIVGQNGTGKSTIVDTVIRLLNNMSAAIIGEEYVYSSAQHLHYIDNVYASLAVYLDTKVMVLACKGSKLALTTFSTNPDELDRLYNAPSNHVIEVYDKPDKVEILKGNESIEKPLPPQNGLRYLLEDWFYTLVSNYSLYAYNYLDYEYERTNEAKLLFYATVNKAWDYLAYKTIKVLWTYKHYESVWERIMHGFDETQFKEDLKELLKDSSHRTLKIRQTLAHLKYREEPGYYLNSVIVDVDDAWDWMSGKIGQDLYYGYDYHQLDKDDLLPPPYVEVVLRLVDNEHYEAYKKGQANDDIIPFGGLSSGERQIAYTIGNILYHLRNLESVKQDFNVSKDHVMAIKYNYVNIFAANIHDLFNDAFFLPNTMGEIAQKKVQEIVGLYHYEKYKRENKGQWRVIDERPDYMKVDDLAKVQYIASILGDSYLHDELTDMVDEMLEWEKEDKHQRHEKD